MRIVFLGSAELACPSLRALAALREHAVVAVVTQPDRPRGRNLQPAPPPVKIAALELGLPVDQPPSIRAPESIARLAALAPDLIVVVAYGQLLPPALLSLPPRGCINVHPSLLPRWRGAAPIQCAVLAGDPETGVTTMYLNERLDAGDVILQAAEPIRADDTAGILHDRLAERGAALLTETVGLLAADRAPRHAQEEAAATYAKKLAKEDGQIDWQRPAVAIERQVRAFDPWPGSFTRWGTQVLKLWRVAVVEGVDGEPGRLLAGGIVATGARTGVRLVEVQGTGGNRMEFAAFCRGHPLIVGTRLG